MSSLQSPAPAEKASAILLGTHAQIILTTLSRNLSDSADFELDEIIDQFPEVTLIELVGIFLRLLDEFSHDTVDDLLWLQDPDGLICSRFKAFSLEEQVVIINIALREWKRYHESVLHLLIHLKLPEGSDAKNMIDMLTRCDYAGVISREMGHDGENIAKGINSLWQTLKSSMRNQGLIHFEETKTA